MIYGELKDETKIYFTIKDGKIVEELPDTLEILNCSYNELNELPKLPSSLKYLYCSYNQLTKLPKLPSRLKHLYCTGNKLNELPELPDSLKQLHCSNNPFKGDDYFTNHRTERIVVKQGERYFAGCFCNKTKEELLQKCTNRRFAEVIKHFNL